MGLADGDAFVSGDLLSFQQAERIRDNWRAASAPSNPQSGSLWSESDTEKIYHRQASAWMVVMQADNSYISTAAAGGYAFRIDAYQDDVTALTGLLRGAYIQASNGDIAATGTIRALELKARAGRPGEVGNNVAVLEGLSISADAKTYDITTVMRGIEISLDGEAGSTITKAVGLRIAQNFQADIATLCYGLEFYRDSFENDADIILSSGGLIGGKAGHLRLTDAGILEIYEDAMTDKLFLYHDGNAAYIKWTDGNLVLMTDKGTNTNTYLDIKGKGNLLGRLRLYDEDDAEHLDFYTSQGWGYIHTAGSTPLGLNFQFNIAEDIKFWRFISSGNPNFYIYGYKTAVGVKYARLSVDTSGGFAVSAEGYITFNTGADQNFYVDFGGIFLWRDIDAADAIRMTLDSATGRLTLTENLYFGAAPEIRQASGVITFQSDEGTNSNTIVDIKGKGTGYGYLRIFDEDAAENIVLYSTGGIGLLRVLGTNPQGLSIQYGEPQDIKCWQAIASGNPWFYLYGYKNAVGVKYLRIQIDTTGSAIIDTEVAGYIRQGGINMFSWESSTLRFFDDKVFAFGTGFDVCMGYMNTGDIWHICDGGTLGAAIRMSVNGTGLSFFGVAPVAQAGHIADTGGDDAAVVNAILVALEDLGLIASA